MNSPDLRYRSQRFIGLCELSFVGRSDRTQPFLSPSPLLFPIDCDPLRPSLIFQSSRIAFFIFQFGTIVPVGAG